ncbi:MAG: DUF1844 domain-containing protein [Phycisphaerae bacterium]|nr:DUF1844 domain-containing protein [Phycisphaerae bacterium]
MADKEEKKIIIDEDWKEQAKHDKEVLAEQEQKEKEEIKKQPKREGRLPKGDFAALISMLATQAFYAMGVIKVNEQDEREPDLEMAKYSIDMLETLEEKTKGSLTEQESTALTNTLSQLRMAFVELSK